jgi:hypothetical protein
MGMNERKSVSKSYMSEKKSPQKNKAKEEIIDQRENETASTLTW